LDRLDRSPNLDNIQCGLTASPSLQCPGCVVHVNDTTVLDQLRAMFETAHCPPVPCPAIACVVPASGVCLAQTDGGPPGTCVDVYR
jgi:hypothetical protein